jgi:hypothetical protein
MSHVGNPSPAGALLPNGLLLDSETESLWDRRGFPLEHQSGSIPLP